MAIKKRPVSPRQKMINLMYVVLMAMLALNVSNEVLNGFAIVGESIGRTTENAIKDNQAIYEAFEEQMKANPQKVKEWYDKAQLVRQMSDSLYNFAADLKLAIAREADGENGDPNHLKGQEDLEASNQVMLAPGRGKGEALKLAIESYRERILKMIPDTAKQRNIASDLTTEVPEEKRSLGKNWQETQFEAMPAIAAVTILSKLQGDVRNAEKEVLHTLVQNIDVKDIRVNLLEAFVIPNSQTIVQGDKFSAKIVMAAIDTTQVPDIYIGGKKMDLKDNVYEQICSRTGDFTLTGWIETVNGNGDKLRRDFEQKYTVVEPSATVSADLTRMLYAGYANPISVSVPGVPLNKISASMTNGTLTPSGPGKYIAKPSKIGQDAVITVTSTNTGRPQTMGSFAFRVRKLPDPTPFIDVKDEAGNPARFKGGNMSKGGLLGAEVVGAAIDDGILDIAFRVQSFETVFFDNMGNAKPLASDGPRFSGAQKDLFRKLTRGRRFYISRVVAVGPDGIERTLNTAMEIKVQ
ncbi:MAG: gliding motility protein GldM [Prevotella sp.]|nr:gliding motility protein GldM [Prevotella sp.]